MDMPHTGGQHIYNQQAETNKQTGLCSYTLPLESEKVKYSISIPTV